MALRSRAMVAVLAAVLAVLAFGQPLSQSLGSTPQLLAATSSGPSIGSTVRTSVTDDGSELSLGTEIGRLQTPQLSADGRWQLFTSESTGPDPDPISPTDQFLQRIFVRDLKNDHTIQISIGNADLGTDPTQPSRPDGTVPDGDSYNPSISADGRYVSFLTDATNIVPGTAGSPATTLVVCDRDPTGAKDAEGNLIFDQIVTVGETQTRDYKCYNVRSSGEGDPFWFDTDQTPQLSGDGTRLVWSEQHDGPSTVEISTVSDANGVAPPSSPRRVRAVGFTPTPYLSEPDVNRSGNRVVMTAQFSDNTTGILETTLGTPQSTRRVDVAPAGSGFTGFIGDETFSCGSGGTCSYEIGTPSTSDSGGKVLFHFGSVFGGSQLPSEVVATVGANQVTSEVVSRDNGSAGDLVGQDVQSYAGAISGSGRFVAFMTEENNTTDGADGAGEWEIVARDLQRDKARLAQGLRRLPGALVTVNANQDCTLTPPAVNCVSSDNADFAISLDRDGERVAFSADAADLIPGDGVTTGDTNEYPDTFVRTWQPSVSNGTTNLSDVPVGSSTQVDLKVSVSGFGAVTWDQIVLGGADASDFSVVGSTCRAQDNTSSPEMYDGETCVIRIRLAPTTPGPKTATVALSSNQFSTPQQVRTLKTGPVAAPADNTRTSVTNNGKESATGGSASMISGNGRWQVFTSDSNLAGHTPIDPADAGQGNIFVRDLADPEHTVQISLHTNVTAGTGPTDPSRTVAVAKHRTGASPNGDSSRPSISSDGRFVSFVTDATDIVPYPPMGQFDTPEAVVVVCDRDPTNTVDSAGNPVLDLPRPGTQVPNYVCFPIQSSAANAGGLSADLSSLPRLSGDGTRITWVETDDSANPRVRVATVSALGAKLHAPTGLQYVPTDISGFEAGTTRSVEDAEQRDPTLTEDGGAVVYRVGFCGFSSCIVQAIVETDIAAGTSIRFDTVPGSDRFLGDGCASSTAQCLVDAPAVSDDGDRVAFGLQRPGDDFKMVYVATRAGSVINTVIASRDNQGNPSAGATPALSGDGRYLAFQTRQPDESNAVDPPGGSCIVDFQQTGVNCQIVARDLVKDAARTPGDPWEPSQIVSSRLSRKCPSLVPAGRLCAANGFSSNPSIDETGSEIGFDSDASDIVSDDGNTIDTGEGIIPAPDAFVHTWRPLLSAPAFAFGAVALGAHKDKTFTLTESGFGPISLGTPSINGVNAGDFGALSTTCAGATLNDTQTCQLKLRFTPTALDNRTATLVTPVGKNGYPRHSPDNTISYDPALLATLTGVGSASVVVVDPTTLDFGRQLPEKDPGTTKTVTVTNTGNEPVTITDVNVQDTTQPGASGDYTVDASDCLGNLPPGASCAITVTFVGHRVGKRDAELVITDNGPSGPATVGLLATVPKPKVVANPGVATPGRVTIVAGSGFAPHLQVDVTLQGSIELVTAVADGKGRFEVGLVIFRHSTPGPREVSAHTHGKSPTISADGPLLLQLGSIDVLQLVTRH